MRFYVLVLSFLLSCFTQAATDANKPYQGITIYIDYSDAPADYSESELDSLLNNMDHSSEGVDRSFRKYWHEQSRGNIDMQHDIFFYRAPQTSAYYANRTWPTSRALWQEALESVIENNPSYDWNSLTKLDSSNDVPRAGGLSVMFINSVWGSPDVGATHYVNWTLSNNVLVNNIYVSVLQASWDTTTNMFMTIHESGHGILGLPDTYDTTGNSGGVSAYTVMSGSHPDVEPIGGPFLAQYDWGNVLEPTSTSQTYTLTADGDDIVVFKNIDDSAEFFTIEARKQSTRGNSRFPTEIGLLIWHTDNRVSTSNTLPNMTATSHYRHSLEQADGLFQIENSSNGIEPEVGDIYLPGDSFTDSTTPNANWWDGSNSGFAVTNIEIISDDEIRFTVTTPNQTPVVDKGDWSLVSALPAFEDYVATNAFDDNTETFYHIPWGNSYVRPHDIVIDMNESYTLDAFYYQGHADNQEPWSGRVKSFEVYVSDDLNNWGSAAASGTFDNIKFEQNIALPNVTGRYLKFSVITSYHDAINETRTTISEITVRGVDSTVITPQLNLPATDASISAAQNSIVLAIESNISWTVSEEASWISLNTGNGSNNGSVTLAISENTSSSDRSANVTVSADGVADKIFVVTQTAAASTEVQQVWPNGEIAVASSEQAPNIASNVGDQSLNSRWSAQNLGEYITFDLGASYNLTEIKVAFFKGGDRQTFFDIATSPDGSSFTTISSGNESSGGGTSLESFIVSGQAQYVRIIGQGNSSNNWNSLTEVEIYGSTSGDVIADQLSANSLSTFSAQENSQTLNVLSNIDWTLTSNNSWVSVSSSSGSENGSVSITVDENTSTVSRQGSITLAGGSITQTIAIEQDGAVIIIDDELVASNYSFDFTANSNSSVVDITTNIDWTLTSNHGWINVSSDSGSDNSSVSISVNENTSTSSRQGTITLAGGSITRTITIEQDGAIIIIEDELIASTSSLNFNEYSDSGVINITANINWQVVDNASWISLDTTNGSNDGGFLVNVSENTSTNDRSGVITITGNDITVTVTVTQAGGETPITTPELLVIDGVIASSDDGNVAENTLDSDLGTRWSANGDGAHVTYDLGAVIQLSEVKIAFFKGTSRNTIFSVAISSDGENFTTVLSNQSSSGNQLTLESFDVAHQSRYVRIIGHGNSSNNWNSLTEVELWGSSL